jgi:hypothetical protein
LKSRPFHRKSGILPTSHILSCVVIKLIVFYLKFLYPNVALKLKPLTWVTLVMSRFSWLVCSHGDKGLFAFDANFWKFYLIRTSFTSGERVSLVKMFRLLWIGTDVLFWCSERVWTQ